jgi:hypothetical protein
VEGAVRSAKAINADARYYFRVSKLLAFGSYLTDCPTLGDVDLAVELKARVEGGEHDSDAIVEYANRAEDAGRRFASLMDELFWPSEEIYRELKGASKAISLHRTTDKVLELATTRVIYLRE